jgi:hypothetical protein
MKHEMIHPEGNFEAPALTIKGAAEAAEAAAGPPLDHGMRWCQSGRRILLAVAAAVPKGGAAVLSVF